FFNIIRPHNIQKHINKAKLPYVISPIFVDYSEIEKKHSSFAVRFLYSLFGSDGISYLKVLARYLVNGENIGDFKYLLRGQKRAIEKILSKTDLLLPNSISEYNRLKLKYKFNTDYMVVPNAVSKDFYKKINLSQKQETVLCIARIELVKNQLNLIKAIRGTDIKLKLIGKPAPNHKKYYEECKRLATDNIIFLGQLDKGEVINELKQAKVHVLPSFFETTGLSSMEALALGCNIVITKKGDAKEYFDKFA